MAQHCCLPGLSKLVDHCPGCLGASPINSGLPPINSGIPPSILGSPHQFRVLPSFYQPPAPPVPIWQSLLPPGIVLAVSPSFLGVLTSFFLHYVRLISALLMHLTRPYNYGYNIYYWPLYSRSRGECLAHISAVFARICSREGAFCSRDRRAQNEPSREQIRPVVPPVHISPPPGEQVYAPWEPLDRLASFFLHLVATNKCILGVHTAYRRTQLPLYEGGINSHL